MLLVLERSTRQRADILVMSGSGSLLLVKDLDAHHPVNPWTTRSSRRVYENPWITVREDQVLQPDGKPGIYGVVEFRNAATGIVALRDDGRIPLVGQWRYPLNAYSWELPEGGAPLGEEPLAAAKRELLEESGLRASSWELLLKSHLSNCITNEVCYIYLARNLTQGDPAPEGCEELALRWVSLSEALQMSLHGQITDAVTQLGLMAAVRRLGL